MKRKGGPSSSSASASSSVLSVASASSSFLSVEPEVRKKWSENRKTRSPDMGVQRRLADDADKEQLCRGCSWKKPHFFKVLIGDFRERLMLPPAFLKHLTVGESGAAVVEDQSNRCWDIELLRRSNGMIFSKGWKQFVDENELETGDFLVFQYDGGLHFTVTIFDKGSCEKITEKRRPRIKAPDVASSFKTTNPSFKTVFLNTPSALHIPVGFSKANHLPKETCWVTLEDSAGRKWSVKCTKNKFFCNGRYYLKRTLTSGWRHFSVESCLKKGDVLIFELIRRNNVFKVHIFRDEQNERL